MRFPTLATTLLLTLAAACAGSGVHVTRVHPAELPVAAYAPLAVLTGPGDAESDLAVAVTAGLRRAGIAVNPVTAMPAAGEAGLVLRPSVRFERHIETRWGTRSENVCSPYGCYVRQVSYPYEIVTVTAFLRLEVVEVPTGAVLGERSAQIQHVGGDSVGVRRGLVLELGQRAARLCTPQQEDLHVRFPRGDEPELARAAGHAEAGRYLDAANLLATLADSPSFASWSESKRFRYFASLSALLEAASAVNGPDVGLYDRAIAATDAALALRRDEDLIRRRAVMVYEADVARAGVQGGSSAPVEIEIPEAYR